MHLSERIHLQDHTVSLPRQSRRVAFVRRLHHRLAWQVAYRPFLMTCHLRVTSKLIERQDYRDPARTSNENHCTVFWDHVGCFIKYTEDGGSSSPSKTCVLVYQTTRHHIFIVIVAKNSQIIQRLKINFITFNTVVLWVIAPRKCLPTSWRAPQTNFDRRTRIAKGPLLLRTPPCLALQLILPLSSRSSK